MNNTYASLWKRLLAVIIDSLIIGIIELPISLISSEWVSALIYIIVVVSYSVYFIGSRGQTIGKMLMKVRVITEDGSKMDYTTAFLREPVGKFVSSFIGIGYLWAIWDKKKQSWHDKIAGTLVVAV